MDPYVRLKKPFALAARLRSFSLSLAVLVDCCCCVVPVSSATLGSGDFGLEMLAAPPRPTCVTPGLGRRSTLEVVDMLAMTLLSGWSSSAL